MTALKWVCKGGNKKYITAVLLYGNGEVEYTRTQLEALARCFIPDIQAFFESEEGRNEYEAWREQQSKLKAQKADKTA